MKLLSTIITDAHGCPKRISVSVDDLTAEILEQCSEAIRHAYIIDEYEDQKLTHTETRRIVSYDQITETGLDFPCLEESPLEILIRKEKYSCLYAALDKLTERQYHILWRYAVDGLTFRAIAEEMGICKTAAHQYYQNAIKKLKKILQ